MVKFRQSKLNFYCYLRLKVDELGLENYEDVRIHEIYEHIYKIFDVESEKLYTPRLDIPLRNNWEKAKTDYLDMVVGIIDEQNAEIGWHTMLAIFTGTKIIVRRYREHNPLFASMLCLEMLIVFNKLGHISSYSPKIEKNVIKRTWMYPASIKRTYSVCSTISVVSLCSYYCWYRLWPALKNYHFLQLPSKILKWNLKST